MAFWFVEVKGLELIKNKIIRFPYSELVHITNDNYCTLMLAYVDIVVGPLRALKSPESSTRKLNLSE